MGKLIKSLQWAAAFLLLCYIVYRACALSITQDEAYTYFLVKTNYWRAMPGTANTHWLNSIFLRIFLWLPGPDDPWKLRLLSMMSWCLYAYSVIRLGEYFNRPLTALAFFAVAMLNPYVIFYFSLSRGYAAAFALVMFAFLQAARVLRRGEMQPSQWWSVFFPASLAVLANFSVFYFYMALTLTYLFHLSVKKQWRLLIQRSSIGWAGLVIGTFVFSIASLLFIRHTGDLEFGGRSNVVNSLFVSLAETGIYIPIDPGWLGRAGWIFCVALIALFILALGKYWDTKVLTLPALSIFCYAGIILLNILLHLVFGVPYLLGRTALIIYVVTLPGLFGARDWIYSKRSLYAVHVAICLLIVFLFSWNFSKSYNTRFFPEWPVQTDTKKGLDYLANKGATDVGMGVWHYAVYYNYYLRAYPGKYPFRAGFIRSGEIDQPADTVKLVHYDYLFLDPPYAVPSACLSNWKQEMYYPDSKALLLSRQY